MPVKVRIDRDECTACESCWAVCPDFFEQNNTDNLSQVVKKYRIEDDIAEGEAPDDLRDCVQEAADSCPVEIIHVD
jgi:ferredoxin